MLISMDWLRTNEGKTFYTITRKPFSYELRKGGLYISRIKDNRPYTFTYENLNNALNQMPVSTPSEFKGIWGHPYCFAILKEYCKINLEQ